MMNLALTPQLQQGFALLRSGRFDEADRIGSELLQADPGCVDAYLLRAGVARSRGTLEQTVELLERAISIKPELALLHLNLGEALLAMNRVDEAISALRRAVTLQPKMADAHVNLGNALLRAEKTSEAIASLRTAVALRPGFAEAHYNLARALQIDSAYHEAIEAYRRAIQLRPGFAQALYSLGTALQILNREAEALACYRQAVAIRPKHHPSWNNLGLSLQHLDQPDEAIEAYQRAISLRPDYAWAHHNLASVLAAVGRVEDAIDYERKAVELDPSAPLVHSGLIMSMQTDARFDAADLFRELTLWNKRHGLPLADQIRPHRNAPHPTRKLRIGYVSSELRDHAVGWNMLPLFRQRDREQFEVYCYYNRATADETTATFRQLSDGWFDIAGQEDEKVAEVIREHQIDILVDLNLHSQGTRLQLFARKPAPVQATFAGYPSSTGLTAIDYRLSDPYLDPPGMFDAICSEKILRLPASFWCFDTQLQYPDVNPLPAQKAGYVTFASFNVLKKVNKVVLALWAQLLQAVPSSHLLLLAPEGTCRERIRSFFQGHGVQAGRVEFHSRRPRMEYLKLYHQADISLDPFPYGGHNSGLDSFWMGVPVVTLVGNTICSRAGWSHLSNLGLADLAATTRDQYIQIATALAGDLPCLAQLRQTLRQRMLASPLCDAASAARGLEQAYRSMWQAWCTSVR